MKLISFKLSLFPNEMPIHVFPLSSDFNKFPFPVAMYQTLFSINTDFRRFGLFTVYAIDQVLPLSAVITQFPFSKIANPNCSFSNAISTILFTLGITRTSLLNKCSTEIPFVINTFF